MGKISSKILYKIGLSYRSFPSYFLLAVSPTKLALTELLILSRSFPLTITLERFLRHARPQINHTQRFYDVKEQFGQELSKYPVHKSLS